MDNILSNNGACIFSFVFFSYCFFTRNGGDKFSNNIRIDIVYVCAYIRQ